MGAYSREDNLKDWRPTHKIQLTRKYTRRKGGQDGCEAVQPLALVSSLEGVTWTWTAHTHIHTLNTPTPLVAHT